MGHRRSQACRQFSYARFSANRITLPVWALAKTPPRIKNVWASRNPLAPDVLGARQELDDLADGGPEAVRRIDQALTESARLLRELHRGGATICMVTHDPRYAAHADRGVHLFDGRVVEENVGTAV